MPWQITDGDGVTDIYESKRDAAEAIKSSMCQDDYIEAARDWGWKVREISATEEKQEHR